MKTKFSFFSDVFFVSLITFTLSLVVFNFFIEYPYSIIYSCCLALLACILFFARSDKRRKISQENREKQKQIEALVSELNFSTKSEQNAIIEKALIKANYTVERKKGGLFVKEKNALLICKFSFNSVRKSEIVSAFNSITKTQKAYILAQSFDAEITTFAERFEGRVILIDGGKTFDFLLKQEAIPKTYKYQRFFKRTKKSGLKNLLDRKKAKTFFIFGVLFLLFSYVSPLKIYYIICGSLFLTYSLVLRLWGKEKNITAQTDNI